MPILINHTIYGKDKRCELISNLFSMKNKKESFTSRVGLFLLLVTFCLGTIQAQSSKITGYVKDQSGEPLIGVNVMEKGTTNGTVTDLNGFYSIVAKASNAVLNFSYIGYRNQEIPVAGKKLINVTMKDDSGRTWMTEPVKSFLRIVP